MVVFKKVKKSQLDKLKGFVQEEVKTVYEELRLKKGPVSLILYTSGKLLLQGKEKEVEKIAEEISKKGVGKKEKQEVFRKEDGWIIGSDESLKGDTFGGMVVAAVKADLKSRKQLIELGVADSKKLSDHEILPLAIKIKKIVQCEVRSILPEEYNKFHGNVTELLNKLHSKVGGYLSPGTHVVDKYPGCDVGDVKEEKAEDKYVEVAAASILARSAALQQLDFLSSEAGFCVPKGSTHVKWALEELKEKDLELDKFVKVGFKNVKEFI
jgi:ribonuclease HIII